MSIDSPAVQAVNNRTELQALVDELVARGVKLQLVENDVLRFSAPKGALTPELKERLRDNKEALKVFLRGTGSAPGGETPEIRPADRSRPLPLSHTQLRLWFLDQMAAGQQNAYNMFDVKDLRGELDVAALRAAFDYMLVRHESLRTSFRETDGRPFQVVEPPTTGILGELTDLSGLSTVAAREKLNTIISTEREHRFDLRHAPLLRVRLIRLTAQHHVLIVTQHHIISDGWSMDVFNSDIIKAYQAFLAGRTPELPPLPLQFADVAAWQNSERRRAELETQLAWWKAQLREAPQGVDWPLDNPRPPIQEASGTQLILDLSPEDSQLWRGLARRFGTTTFMVGAALYTALLSRLCGQKDLVIGSPAANRDRAEFESIIGFFANTLPLRFRLDDDPDLPALLNHVRSVILAADERKEVAFERIVEVLQPERRSDQDPIIQTVYTLHVLAARRVDLDAISFESFKPDDQNAKFDCSLFTVESGANLVNMWEFRSSLFRRETILEWQERMMQLLRAWSAAPQARLSDIDIMLPGERRELLGAAVKRNVDGETIVSRFESIAAQFADKVALRDADGTTSYAELRDMAHRWAWWLNYEGIGPDMRVGVVLRRRREDIALILGVLTAGAAYVPLDEDYPTARLQAMCQLADVKLVLGPKSLSLGPGFRKYDIEAMQAGIAELHPVDPKNKPTADSAAYVMFTSGSTGTPKGVLVPHRAVTRLCIDPDWIDVGPDDRFGGLAPLGFDASTLEVFMPLLNGAELVLQTDKRAGVHELGEFIASHRLTALWLTSGLFSLMVDLAVEQLTSLRYLLAGGDVLAPQHVKQALAALPHTQVLNGYGPTENTTFTTTFRIPRDYDGLRALPIGRPISGTCVRILDENMRLQPRGVAGELYAGGEGLARAYAGDPRRTALSFVPDPFAAEPGGRLYRTGDRVRLNRKGEIEFLGRMDRQVKISGHRIDPREVEAVLTRHSQVRRAAVVIRGDQAENRRMIAFVECSGERPGQNELAAFAQSLLPNYMAPAAFVFVDRMPLNVNGKIDRRALDRHDIEQHAGGTEAPSNKAEADICAIFARVLQRESVGPNDNFFHLGGHSLLATQLVSRLRAELNLDAPISLVFNSPTPREMMRSLGGMQAESGLPQLPAHSARLTSAPLTAAQNRLWFLAHMPGAGAAYNMPAALYMRGALDIARLRRALDLLVEQHSVLRTRIVMQSDAEDRREARQVIDSGVKASFNIVDLRSDKFSTGAAQSKSIIEREFSHEFKLADEHPLRCSLLILQHDGNDDVADPRGAYIFVVNVHHIAGDAWSFNIFVQDLLRFYGGDEHIDQKALQYADFAVWQQQWRAAGGLDRQREFWRETLQGAPTQLDLPTDRDHGAVQSFRGGHIHIEFDVDLQARWTSLGAELGATPFMTYLAVWGLLLGRHAATDDVLIAAPIANRNRPEVEKIMGFFVNTLVLRVKQTPGQSAPEFLASVMQHCLQAYSNQDLPFEELLELLHVERIPGRSPLVQVMFDVQNAAMAPLELPGLSINMMDADFDAAKFELSLTLAETNGNWQAMLEYNRDLFDRESAEKIGRRYVQLLDTISRRPDVKLEDLDGLTDTERDVCLDRDHQATSTDLTFPELFNRNAQQFSERPAVVFGDEQLTYAQLYNHSLRLAGALQARGVEPGDYVGVSLQRGPLLPVALLAVLQCGAAFVPLDVSYPVSRLTYMLEDTQPRLILVDAVTADAEVFNGKQILRADEVDLEREFKQTNIEPASIAYVIYTSGSTGRPKGVAITHAALRHYLQHFLTFGAVGPDDRYSQFASINFDAAVEEFFTPLCTGACIVLPRESDLGDFNSFEEFLVRHAVTVASMTTAFWQEWMAAGDGSLNLPHLRRVVMGGEAGRREAVARFEARLPQRELLNCYGPTETTISAAIEQVKQSGDPGRGSVPVGRPVGETRIYLLDAAMRLVPPGVVGDVWIGGPQLAREYVKRPAATAWAFVPDPFAFRAGARLYRSGDRARQLPDGRLHFVGRADDQVKIRGFRIELGEIEQCLMQHPAVERAALQLRQTQSTQHLAAWVELLEEFKRPGAAEELGKYLRLHLPAHMQPNSLTVLDAIPRLPNGKTDYQALSQLEDRVSPPRTGAATPPATELERRLADIWRRTLEVDIEDIHANFFDLGGNSLKSIALLTRLQESFPGVFDAADMFDKNTIRLQAEAIGASKLSSDAAAADTEVNKKRIGKIRL